MDRLKRDREQTPFLYSPLVLGVLGLFSLVLVVNVYRVYMLSRAVAQEKQQLDATVQTSEAEINDLQNKIRLLESGEGLELEARSKLNLQKPDEKVLIVIEDDKKNGAATSTDKESWFGRLKKWLGFGIN